MRAREREEGRVRGYGDREGEGRERGRDREGLRAKEREEGRKRGGRGRIVSVKFGEIPRCCLQKVDRDTKGPM